MGRVVVMSSRGYASLFQSVAVLGLFITWLAGDDLSHTYMVMIGVPVIGLSLLSLYLNIRYLWSGDE